MASEVGICNLALAHLGDVASVSSIVPPDPSVQAGYCAQFYPIARDALLEMHTWGFATVNASLALLSNVPRTEWAYAYTQPSDAVNLLGVLASDAQDDYSTGFPAAYPGMVIGFPLVGSYTPQPYSAEALVDGTEIILTNQANAVLRYTRIVTDPTKFSPLFTTTLSWLLASYLAGPILKGDAGVAAAQAAYKTFLMDFKEATESDANQRRINPLQAVPWVAGR